MIQIGTTSIDAQMFAGKGRYLININMAAFHLEILQSLDSQRNQERSLGGLHPTGPMS
jgi:hypothetical protein